MNFREYIGRLPKRTEKCLLDFRYICSKYEDKLFLGFWQRRLAFHSVLKNKTNRQEMFGIRDPRSLDVVASGSVRNS